MNKTENMLSAFTVVVRLVADVNIASRNEKTKNIFR